MTREQIIQASVDAILDSIEREGRKAESFEYLEDPHALVERRGYITGKKVG